MTVTLQRLSTQVDPKVAAKTQEWLLGYKQPFWHIHFFRLHHASLEHNYELCRCGTRRARRMVPGDVPVDVEWIADAIRDEPEAEATA